jgi:N-acetyltransferase
VASVGFVEPLVLAGERLVLEPLQLSHHDALVEAASDGQLWTLGYTGVPRPEQMRDSIAHYLGLQAEGLPMPFTVRLCGTGRVIGQTTYCNIEADHRRLEFGGTWNARSVRRSGTNTESKLLLLSHAFDQLNRIAVEFRTHWLNHQSRRAIARSGAKQDGVLRSHRIMPWHTTGHRRLLILEHEWPAIRNELQRRVAADRRQAPLSKE